MSEQSNKDYLEKLSYHLYNSINVFISLYNFQNELKKNVNNNNNNPGQKLILIDKEWLENYKNFYLYNDFINIMIENNLTFKNQYEKKYVFNNIFKIFRSKNNNQKLLLFYDKNEEFPRIINYKNNINICFISEFEIISEEIYNNLKKHMGNLSISSSVDDKKFEYIKFSGKVIFKYIKDEKCYNLLICNYDNNKSIYVPEIYVNYKSENKLEEEFRLLHDPKNVILQQFDEFKNDNKNIIDMTQEYYSENKNIYFTHSKFFAYGYDDINKLELTNEPNKEENSDNINKIVEFFVKLFIEYKVIQKNIIEKSIYDEEYYLINKNWIDKFKQFYYYNKLEEILNNNNSTRYIYDENIFVSLTNNVPPQFYNQLKNLNNRELIYNLSNINLNEVNYNYCEIAKKNNKDYIKVYKDFELWTKEAYNSFSNLGFTEHVKPKIIKCYFENRHIFIYTKNNSSQFLNIYYLTDNFIFDKKMVIKCKNMDIILQKIKNKSFFRYIYSLNSNDNEMFKIRDKEGDGFAYALSDEGKIYDKIVKKKKRIEIIINLLIGNEEIKRKMNQKIKDNYETNNNKTEKFYLVHQQLFNEYLKQSGLLGTYKYIIEKKLAKNFADKKSLVNRKNEIKNFINDINKISEDQIEKQSNMSYITIQGLQKNDGFLYYILVKNHEQLFFHNNCYLLDEETIGKINENYKQNLANFECLIGDKRIFIFNNIAHKHIIEVGKLDKNGVFQIDLIIDVYNNYEEEQLKIIYSKGDYVKTYFVFGGDKKDKYASVSPYFDNNRKLKGYGYLLNQNVFNKNKVEDFSDCHINKYLVKMIYLLIFFMNTKTIFENKIFKKYYLINENWINKFKEKINYDKTKEAIKKNENANNLLESMSKIITDNKDENKNLLIKQIYLLIENIPETNKMYNDIEKEFSNENLTEEPDFERFPLVEEEIPFYNNFYLIEKNTFEQIYDIEERYSKEMENKNNYCECDYSQELIFIKLKNHLIKDSNKILIEVGELDNSTNKFILEYIFLCNNENDYKTTFEYLKNYGFKKYLYQLVFRNTQVLSISINSKHLGYIYKSGKISKIKEDNSILKIEKKKEKDIQEIKMSQITNTINSIANLNQQPPYVPIKNKFLQAPKIGLQNVGATCYMNATLQCLCQIEKLVDYFKSSNRISQIIEKYKSKKENSLTDSFKYLIENLWPTDEKYKKPGYNLKNQNNNYFVPKEFKEKISKMNPLFAGAKANDSKDLVNYIIMRLHEELNEGDKYENNNVPSQEDEKSMFDFFKNSSEFENKSIISDLFYGINGTLYECSKCHTKKYNYQIGFFYIFPLEEVRKFKIQNLKQNYMKLFQYQMLQMAQFGFMNNMNMNYMNNMNMNNMNNMNMNNMNNMNMNNMNNMNMNNLNNMNMNNMNLMCQPYFAQIQNINSVNIIDCFDFNQKIETMNGENSMYCNICKRQESAYYQSYIVTTPEIIIIILNRGKGIEFNVKLEFTELLNIQNYVKNNNSPHTFKLIGVVTHLGESGASGHFIAYCLSPIDNKWYNYNDDLCIPVTNFQEQVINYAMPYILFYKRV